MHKDFAWWYQRFWILSLILFIALPVLWAMVYALAFSFGVVGRLSMGWTLEHWRSALMDGFIGRTIGFSLYVATCVTCMVMTIALSVAVLLKEIRHSRLLLIMLLLLSGTPAVVVATQIINWGGGGGLLSRLAFQIGFIESPNEFPAIAQDNWAIGVIVGISLNLLPLATLYFMTLWDTVGFDRYCRLAEQLGCNPWQARVQVAIPMMLHRGSAMLVLVFLLALGSFEIPFLLGRQSPQMFSVTTQQRAGQFNLLSRPQAFALTTVYFATCSSLLIVYLRLRRVYDDP